MFCEDCITEINIGLQPRCPLCNREFMVFNEIKRCNRFAYNILSNVKIHCPNKDCKEIFKAGDVTYHMAVCDYKTVDCPYCDKKNIYRKDLKDHYKTNMEDHFYKLIETVEKLKKKIN